MIRTMLTIAVIALGLAVPATSAAQSRGNASGAGGEGCRVDATLVEVPELREGSGLALGGDGRLWSHNDSGQPLLYSLDTSGRVTATVRVSGAEVGDWEAITSGPCGDARCLYIGDIGDNNARRENVTVYRLREPAPGATEASVDAVFRATYPDGAHDAEALFLAGGRLHIITKGETGPVILYRFPESPQPGSTVRLERVGQLRGRAPRADRITDAAVSPDGRWIALRTLSYLTFYPTERFLEGRGDAGARVDLRPLRERQGEGLALGSDGMVYLVSEGGGGRRPGTFARFTCAP